MLSADLVPSFQEMTQQNWKRAEKSNENDWKHRRLSKQRAPEEHSSAWKRWNLGGTWHKSTKSSLDRGDKHRWIVVLRHTQCKNQRASNEPDRNQMQNRQKGLLFTQQKINLWESLPGTLHNWQGFTGSEPFTGKVSCAERQTGGYHTNYMFKSETKIAAIWESSGVNILHAYSAFILS